MGYAPPRVIVEAIENGVAQVTRRVQVYEADGVTAWNPDAQNDPEFKRLVTGTVTVDYTSDERRKLDLTLLNDDGLLRLNPRGGFYYDKIVKAFRGIRYSPYLTIPPVALADFDGTYAEKSELVRQVAVMGYELVDLTDSTDPADFAGYAIVMAATYNRVTSKKQLLKDIFFSGRHVVTIGHKNTGLEVPFIITDGPASYAYGLSTPTGDNPLAGSFAPSGVIATATGTRATGLTAWGQAVAVWPAVPSNTSITASIGTNSRSAYWLDLHLPTVTNTAAQAILDAGLDFMRGKLSSELTWEYQLGEFMIDGINDQIFPDQVKVTLRDYTKKLLLDKIQASSTFVAGTSLLTFIRAIASAGGIKKFRISVGDETFPSDVSYERDTARWTMLKEACTSFGYEIFFDNEGYLVVRKYLDPTTSALSHTFLTGREGNLISFERSINDSRIYNVVRIFGDPSDTSNARLPYFGQAANEDPNSPTSTVRIGRRPYTFASTYFESDAQCQELANTLLRILALESYEVNFSSIFYPWLEVGEIVEILDPNAIATDPTRYLMDSLSMPLDLGPMTGTGKRVTVVGTAAGSPAGLPGGS